MDSGQTFWKYCEDGANILPQGLKKSKMLSCASGWQIISKKDWRFFLKNLCFQNSKPLKSCQNILKLWILFISVENPERNICKSRNRFYYNIHSSGVLFFLKKIKISAASFLIVPNKPEFWENVSRSKQNGFFLYSLGPPPTKIKFLNCIKFLTCIFLKGYYYFFNISLPGSVFLGKIKEAFDRSPDLQNLLLDVFFKTAVENCQVR